MRWAHEHRGFVRLVQEWHNPVEKLNFEHLSFFFFFFFYLWEDVLDVTDKKYSNQKIAVTQPFWNYHKNRLLVQYVHICISL